MTQIQEKSRGSELRRKEAQRLVPPLTLSQAVPRDWHRDTPAFAGDPDMDWESLPEPPRETNWGRTLLRH